MPSVAKTHTKDMVAYRDIKKLLFQRRLPPGQKIIYRDLEEALGMSKTPIICALARLEKEGLVVSRRNRGFYVRELGADEVQKMYDLRMRLEEIAIEYALQDGAPGRKRLEPLKCALDAYVGYNATIYDAKRFKLDAEFHTAIAHLGGNSFLTHILERFYLTAWVNINLAAFTPCIGLFKADHQALFAAIEGGDAKKAKAVMRRHEHRAMMAMADATINTVESDYFSNL